MASKSPQRWANALVDHPRWNMAFLTAVTIVAGLGYYDPQLLLPQRNDVANSSTGNSASSGPRSASRPGRPVGNRRQLSINQADVVIVATSENFFSPTGAAAMRQVVADLENLPTVDNVMWLDRAPPLNIFGLPEPIFPRTDASAQRFAAAKQKAQQHPLVVGQLMSEDAKTLLLLVRMDWLNVRTDKQCTEDLKAVATETVSRFPEAKIDFQLTGDVPMTLMILATEKANQLKYQLIGYGMILLLARVLFRGLVAVIIVAAAPALGVFWTLGALRYLDLHGNPFNTVILPIMISLIGFTDGVHMMVQIRKQRSLGLDPIAATKKGLVDVGAACLLTLFTTSIGFASLGLAHHEIVREFGWSCVMGVAISFVAVISVIPLATASRLGQTVHVGQGTGFIDRSLPKISVAISYSIAHARVISWMAIVVTLVLAAIALTLRPDDRLANALPAGSEPQLAMAHLDRSLGGLQMSEIRISWTEKVAKDAPEIFELVETIDSMLAEEDLLGSPLSITRLLKALPGDGPLIERISMTELLPPPLKEAYYSGDQRSAKLTFRVQDRGIAAYGPVFDRLESQLAQLQQTHPQFTLQLSGRAVERWRNLYQIVLDLGTSLGGEAIIILILLGIAYRSLRIGLIAFVPNIFPLAVTGAGMVCIGQPLELVSVCAFTVCLGIAVDDTIHFLTRYKEELANGHDEQSAVKTAFIGVGTGMIMTTVVLVAGFSTVLISEVRDHRVFCAMGGVTLTAALFGDIFLLPALLVHFRPRKKPIVDQPAKAVGD